MAMAKHTIDHSCGHSHDYQLFGPTKDRDRKIEWLATQDCPRCRRDDAGPLAIVKRTVAGEAFIEITNSYAIREMLRARGYRFSRELLVPSESADLLKQMMNRPEAGWWKKFTGAAAIAAELADLEQQGCEIRELSPTATMLLSPIEGRPELAGLDPKTLESKR